MYDKLVAPSDSTELCCGLEVYMYIFSKGAILSVCLECKVFEVVIGWM